MVNSIVLVGKLAPIEECGGGLPQRDRALVIERSAAQAAIVGVGSDVFYLHCGAVSDKIEGLEPGALIGVQGHIVRSGSIGWIVIVNNVRILGTKRTAAELVSAT